MQIPDIAFGDIPPDPVAPDALIGIKRRQTNPSRGNPAQWDGFVAALAQAQATGRLSLSLVGADDNIVSDTVEVDQRQLLGIQEKKVVEAPKKKKCFVTRRAGEERVKVEIPCTN